MNNILKLIALLFLLLTLNSCCEDSRQGLYNSSPVNQSEYRNTVGYYPNGRR
jgi:hypothetical protein